MLFLQGISRLRARPKGKKTDERLRSPFGNLRRRNFGEIPYWLRRRFCLVRAPPHNSAARLAMSFPPSAACKFLDLHPVNLRNLHLHLTKNPFASRPPHLCGVTLSTNVFSYCGNVPSVFVDKNGHERKLYDNLSEPWATKLMSQFFDMDSLLQNLNLKFSDGYVVDCYLSEADALRINTINEEVRGKITEPLANIELALKLAFPEEMEEVSASIEDAFTVSSGYYTQYVAYYYQYNDTLGYPLRVGKWRFTINVYEENENGESPVELWADRIPFGSNACIVRTTFAIDTSEPRPKPEWNGSLIPHIYLLHSMNWSE